MQNKLLPFFYKSFPGSLLHILQEKRNFEHASRAKIQVSVPQSIISNQNLAQTISLKTFKKNERKRKECLEESRTESTMRTVTFIHIHPRVWDSTFLFLYRINFKIQVSVEVNE